MVLVQSPTKKLNAETPSRGRNRWAWCILIFGLSLRIALIVDFGATGYPNTTTQIATRTYVSNTNTEHKEEDISAADDTFSFSNVANNEDKKEDVSASDDSAFSLSNNTNAVYKKEDISAADDKSFSFIVKFGGRKGDQGIKTMCNKLEELKYWRKREQNIPSNVTAKFNYTWYCENNRIGNALSQYYFNRVLAAHAGINYEIIKSASCQKSESIFDLLGDAQPLNITNTSSPWRDLCSSCMEDKYSDNGKFPHECHHWKMNELVPFLKQEFAVLANKTLQRHVELEHEIDDVAIHLRIALSDFERMGLLSFRHYLDLIPSNALRIGIVTAPVAVRRTPSDRDTIKIEITNRLHNFLRQHFPNATISLRNSVNDTASMVYTRLIQARRMTVCSGSTYCLYPAIASNGVGIVIWNRKRYPTWVNRLDDGKLDGLIKVPRIPYAKIEEGKDLGLEMIEKLCSNETER